MTNGAQEFFVKFFDIGPILGQSTERLVALSGRVQPNQVNAQAAGLVPVVTRNGRYVPADASGSESPVEKVADLPRVPSDSDGWFTLEVDARRWKGVDGVLTVLIYDTDLGDRTFLANVGTHVLTLPRRLSARRAAPAGRVTVLGQTPAGTRAAMCSELDKFLRGSMASSLKASVVRLRG